MSALDFTAHVRKSAISNFVTNLVINGALAWWLLSGNASLSAWGEAAYGPDLLITGFLLCAIVAAIVMELSRRQATRGELAVAAEQWPALASASARNRWGLCALAGAAGALASLVFALACASLVASLSVPAYAGIKGVWAGVLAAAVVVPATVLGAVRGMATPAPTSR
ncbi:MAG: hypothetical protein QF570_05230 [Myxococcota bacterium]|jgi:hypothetical protein|nr:hypothetical protein [Myxococcota bacterium]